MFSSNQITQYLMLFGVILVAGYFGNSFNQKFQNKDEYDLIKQYLLNESPLYGFNRPKLWIHSKYEVNARKWKDFYSRNTTDLNQPYIHLTIKTIINHCGNDFNICLIDDDTFSKLIPTWDIDLSNIAEPKKSQYRELGMMQLIYYYGGMVLPNSTICLKNLKPFYQEGIAGNKPFVCENINRNVNLMKQKQKLLFTPDTFIMGAPKNDPTIKEFIEYLKQANMDPHFSSEMDFLGISSQWCMDTINKGQMNLIMGQRIGVKTQDRKTVLLEDLMEENFLHLSTDCVAVYIPREEILSRPKYQWFAAMNGEEILNANMIVAKYLKASIVDSTNEYHAPAEQKSVVSI